MLEILDRTVLALALAAALSFLLAGVMWLIAQRASRRDTPAAVVSDDEADATVYPYVFVSDTGSVRELSRKERDYLQTPFAPRDLMRPYVKSTYDERNLAGTLRGYCRRTAIPRSVRIAYPPIEIPPPARTAPPFPAVRPPANAAAGGREMLY